MHYRNIPLIAIAGFLAAITFPARASVQLVKAGDTGTPVGFLLVDSATGQIGQTGKTGSPAGAKVACVAGAAGSITVQVAISGSGTTGLPANGVGSVAETGNGDYDYYPAASEVATAGRILKITVSCAGCMTQDYSEQIVAFDPNDANLLGLTGVATGIGLTALSNKIGTPVGISVAADIAANATAIAAGNTVLGKFQFDANLYLKTNLFAYNTGLDPATQILMTPGQKIYTTSAGYLRLDLTQPLDITQLGTTLGGGLLGGWSTGLGGIVISGNQMKLIAGDGTTVIKAFTLTPMPTAAARQ